MMKIKLNFHSPKWLDSLSDVSSDTPPTWQVDVDQNLKPGFLILEGLRISTEDESLFSPLKGSFVDEDARVFYLNLPTDKPAEQVSYTFAASMLGQLLRGKELIEALKMLNAHFATDKPGHSDNESQKE